MKYTVAHSFKNCLKMHQNKEALFFKKNSSWYPISWKAYYNENLLVARALKSLGFKKQDKTSIIGFNRPEWFYANMGTIFAGGVPAGIYTTSSSDQCYYIAHHSESKVIFAENLEQLSKFIEKEKELSYVTHYVLMDGEFKHSKVLSWKDFIAKANETPESVVLKEMDEQKEEELATLVYTSGTTGNPKAVMLSHKNLTWTAQNIISLLYPEENDSCISYLPLSHIAEQMVNLHAPLHSGHSVWFAESMEALGENLKEVRPSLFLGVPRVWEKIKEKFESKLATAKLPMKLMFKSAQKVGLAKAYADQNKQNLPLLYPFFQRTLFKKVKKALGFDRARLLVTAAAPIGKSTLDFFSSIDLPICEIYGMSECAGPATISLPFRYKTGKAGYVLPHTEIKIASDGEILIKGPHVFMGYYKNPEATQDTLDRDHFLHSGDVGSLDSESFLQITDRKKDLIITAGGENIAPQVIEGLLQTIPGVAQAVVVGDQRKYLTALLTLEDETAFKVAQGLGSRAKTKDELVECGIFKKYIHDQLEKLNLGLARVQTIKKFTLLPHNFSIEGEELTPTMKIRRKKILERYRETIGEMYL